MADIKEVWIDDISLTFRAVPGGDPTVMGEGQTYAADGTPLRHYGPTDLYPDLTVGDRAQVKRFLDRAQAALQEAFEIPAADLLPASPLPPPPPTGPEPEVLLVPPPPVPEVVEPVAIPPHPPPPPSGGG